MPVLPVSRILAVFCFALVVEAGGKPARAGLHFYPDVRWPASFGWRDGGEGHGTRLAQKALHQTTGEPGKAAAPYLCQHALPINPVQSTPTVEFPFPPSDRVHSYEPRPYPRVRSRNRVRTFS